MGGETVKISVQEKIAELERRIADLERGRRTDAYATRTVLRVDPEPEMGRVFRAMDALCAKVFGPRGHRG